MSLGSGCVYTGIVIHELMHAIGEEILKFDFFRLQKKLRPSPTVGFWHEQSRMDRDDFIEIIYPNIMSSMRYNFDKMSNRQIDHLGMPYDTCSVMHYNAFAFTMVREGKVVTLGLRED